MKTVSQFLLSLNLPLVMLLFLTFFNAASAMQNWQGIQAVAQEDGRSPTFISILKEINTNRGSHQMANFLCFCLSAWKLQDFYESPVDMIGSSLIAAWALSYCAVTMYMIAKNRSYYRQYKRNSSLIDAAREGNLQQVNSALKEGASVHYLESQNWGALYCSLLLERLTIADQLKKHDANLEPVMKPGYEPPFLSLLKANNLNTAQSVEWLLKNGVRGPRNDPELAAQAFYFVCKNKKLELLKLFHTYGMNLNCVIAEDMHFKYTPLHICAREGFYEGVVFCGQHGINLNQQTAGSNTALHYAAALPQADILCYLLHKGADKTIKNKNGDLPETYAPANSLHQKLLQEKSRPTLPAVSAQRIKIHDQMLCADFSHGENIYRVLRQRELGLK